VNLEPDCGFYAFAKLHARPARTAPTTEQPARGCATRVFHASLPLAQTAALNVAGIERQVPAVPGRVAELGAFCDNRVRAALQRALPPPCGPALRDRLEWYGCRGAFFHTDAHYDGVLFGVWCVAGPPRELVFPRGGLRLPARPGAVAVFDPYEPHAVLDAGRLRYIADDYVGAAPSVFVGFEIELAPAVCDVFGVMAPAAGAIELSSRRAVNAETGGFEA
jgi:hypothetical protein